MINIDKLKGLMKEKRVTQSELAEKLGIKTCTMNQKLNGKRDLSLDEAEIIAEVLDIDVGDFGKYFFNRSVA